jgi:uncharacterized membrane protein YdbT with pleckstrin-like domain
MNNMPSFPGLNPGEEVILHRRRHWLMLLWRTTLPLLLILAALAAVIALTAGLPEWQGGVLLGFLVLLMTLSLWLLWQAYDWWNDEFILTNQRVIHREQHFIFDESRREAQLSRIQNVAVKIPNLITNLCNVGNLIVETAGFEGRIEFDYISDPKSIQKKILEFRGLPRPAESPIRTAPFYRHTLPVAPIRENATITWHKHWFILLKAITPPLLAIVFLIVLLVWFGTSPQILDSLGQAAGPVQVALVLLLIVASLVFLWQYVDWWNDIYVLTEDRIIDIRRIPLIYEDRREAYLYQIQDVSYKIPTLLYRILGLGNVFIETAGKAENFLFETVPNPAQVQREIISRLRTFQAQQQAEAQKTLIQETVKGVLEELRQQATQGQGSPPAATSP